MLHVSARYLTATTQDLVLAIRKEPSVPRVFAIYSDDGSGDQIPGRTTRRWAASWTGASPERTDPDGESQSRLP